MLSSKLSLFSSMLFGSVSRSRSAVSSSCRCFSTKSKFTSGNNYATGNNIGFVKTNNYYNHPNHNHSNKYNMLFFFNNNNIIPYPNHLHNNFMMTVTRFKHAIKTKRGVAKRFRLKGNGRLKR